MWTNVKSVTFTGQRAFHIYIADESGGWPELEKLTLYYHDDVGEYFRCAQPLSRTVSVGDVVHWRRNDSPRQFTPGLVLQIQEFSRESSVKILLGPVPTARQRIGKFLTHLGL